MAVDSVTGLRSDRAGGRCVDGSTADAWTRPATMPLADTIRLPEMGAANRQIRRGHLTAQPIATYRADLEPEERCDIGRGPPLRFAVQLIRHEVSGRLIQH